MGRGARWFDGDRLERELAEYRKRHARRPVIMSQDPAFVLFVVFLVLKLTDQIAWSWWWVVSPVWIAISLAVLAVTCAHVARKIRGGDHG